MPLAQMWPKLFLAPAFGGRTPSGVERFSDIPGSIPRHFEQRSKPYEISFSQQSVLRSFVDEAFRFHSRLTT